MEEPQDRANLVYGIFLLHGIGMLMPWNMFINAFDYFSLYKLSESYIGYKFPYLMEFVQYLTFCSQIPNIIFNWLNIFIQIGGDRTKRVVWSILTVVIVFVITAALVLIDTSSYAHTFFYITLVSVVVLNSANGIYQNTIFGMAAKLPVEYTGSLILGNNISGTFTSILEIMTKAITSNQRLAAMYYFLTALFVLFVCLGSYFVLPLTKFYRFFTTKAEEALTQEQSRMVLSGVDIAMSEKPPYLHILKKARPQLVNVALVFFVSLGIFPSIHQNIRRSSKSFFISENYFRSITCFLTFNVMAMIGSFVPSFVIWPSADLLWIPVTLRCLYFPFFLLCNYQLDYVDRRLPVLFGNDWVYWFVAATFAFTNGYFSSLAMMYAPGTVEEAYAADAGMFASASLITGIFAGILLSFLWPWLLKL